jgi:hypothetical protein
MSQFLQLDLEIQTLTENQSLFSQIWQLSRSGKKFILNIRQIFFATQVKKKHAIS